MCTASCWVASCGCCWMPSGSAMFRVRLQRALSAGVPAADKAAWVDGFFADGALLLIHDAELRSLLDELGVPAGRGSVRRHVAAAKTDIRHLRCRRTSNDCRTDRSWRRESSIVSVRKSLISSWQPLRWQPSISFSAGAMTEAAGRTERQTRLLALAVAARRGVRGGAGYLAEPGGAEDGCRTRRAL